MRAPRRRALAFAAVFLAAGLLSWADPVRSGEAGKPAFPETAEAAAPRTCTCELEGQIEDCCCAFGDIDQLNGQIAPLLSRLMKTTFFRFYKADMHRKCLFWDDDEGKCGKRACTVESCPDEEVPSAVRQQETAAAFQCAVRSTGLESGVSLGLLNDTITESEQAAFETWQLHDNRLHTYCDVGDEADGVAKYVNLVDNPERFTGYAGNSAARIWRSIYMENCFKPEQDVKYLTSMVVNAMCLEKRVFHRVVSGLHATINIHVAASYPKPSSASGVPTFVLGPDTLSSEVEEWGPNITLFRKFFSPQRTFGEGPKWLKNVCVPCPGDLHHWSYPTPNPLLRVFGVSPRCSARALFCLLVPSPFIWRAASCTPSRRQRLVPWPQVLHLRHAGPRGSEGGPHVGSATLPHGQCRGGRGGQRHGPGSDRDGSQVCTAVASS